MAMNNTDIVTSHEVIDTSADNDQMELFELAISRLDHDELNEINDYLGAGVAADSDWRDYWNAFAKYEWNDFSNAYYEVMGRNFAL
jgi:hypothetical protein